MAAWLTTRLGEPPGGIGVTSHRLDSGRAGPRVVVLGGVHGDETQGVRACLGIIASLTGDDLRMGALDIVPVAHEAAFTAGTRTSPIDDGNLAREFPGEPLGRATSRVADLVRREVLDHADVLIDLHSSGIHYAMPLLVGHCDDGSPASGRARELASAAALPVTWRHPGPPPPGRTGTEPHARGVPFVYLESDEAKDEAPAYVDAVRRMLGHLGMLDATRPPTRAHGRAASRSLSGPGDLDDDAVRADLDGLCQVVVPLLAEVRGGDLVARQVDARSREGHDLRARSDGVVVMRRETRVARAGDLLVFLTGQGD